MSMDQRRDTQQVISRPRGFYRHQMEYIKCLNKVIRWGREMGQP